jgi:hypothetical protein
MILKVHMMIKQNWFFLLILDVYFLCNIYGFYFGTRINIDVMFILLNNVFVVDTMLLVFCF